MQIISLMFLLACGAKDTDTAQEPTTQPETPPAEPEEPPEPEDPPEPEGPPEPETQPSSEPVGDPSAGEAIVNQRCMGCHANNAEIENAANMSDAEIEALFENGAGYMPPQNLTAEELLDVIAYLRQTYGCG